MSQSKHTSKHNKTSAASMSGYMSTQQPCPSCGRCPTCGYVGAPRWSYFTTTASNEPLTFGPNCTTGTTWS